MGFNDDGIWTHAFTPTLGLHQSSGRSILNQILRSLTRFPQRLKRVRIIALTFLPDGRVPKAPYRGAKTFDRLIPNPEGFRQSVFQDFALGIEGLLGRWRDRNVSSLGKNRAKFLEDVPSAQPALL